MCDLGPTLISLSLFTISQSAVFTMFSFNIIRCFSQGDYEKGITEDHSHSVSQFLTKIFFIYFFIYRQCPCYNIFFMNLFRNKQYRELSECIHAENNERVIGSCDRLGVLILRLAFCLLLVLLVNHSF